MSWWLGSGDDTSEMDLPPGGKSISVGVLKLHHLRQPAVPVVFAHNGSLGFSDGDGLFFAVPSRPGLLAVRPPGPTGALDGWEH